MDVSRREGCGYSYTEGEREEEEKEREVGGRGGGGGGGVGGEADVPCCAAHAVQSRAVLSGSFQHIREKQWRVHRHCSPPHPPPAQEHTTHTAMLM